MACRGSGRAREAEAAKLAGDEPGPLHAVELRAFRHLARLRQRRAFFHDTSAAICSSCPAF